MQAAKAAGAVVSFDLNYRAKLWASVGGMTRAHADHSPYRQQCRCPDRQRRRFAKRTWHRRPGSGGREIAARSGRLLHADRSRREQHPNIKLVATTLREVHSTNRHDWAAVLWLNGKRYVSPTCNLDVHDRIGGGDGFASGLIYGLLTAVRRTKPCVSAGPTAPCSPPSPATSRWPGSPRSRPSPKGGSARVQR